MDSLACRPVANSDKNGMRSKEREGNELKIWSEGVQVEKMGCCGEMKWSWRRERVCGVVEIAE